MRIKDLENICAEQGIGLNVIPYDGKSTLRAHKDELVIVSKDWINALSNDDKAFEILLTIAECVCYECSDDPCLVIIETINQAIDFAIPFSLRISEEKKKQTLLKYRYTEEDFELVDWFAELSGETTMLQLFKIYGLPLKLTMPHFFGDFYYVAEKKNDSEEVFEGTQYRNGKVYREKSYPYSEECSRYLEKKDVSKRVRDYNHSIGERIKKKDSFEEVEVNNERLLPHQKAGVLLASRYDKFAFFYDTGTGKTVMTLSIIKQKEDLEDARFLILAPKAIIKTAWMEDAANFFPNLRIYPLSNNIDIYDLKELYEQWEKHTCIEKGARIGKRTWTNALKEIDFDEVGFEKVWDRREKARRKIEATMKKLAEHFIVNIEKFRYDPDAILDACDVNGLVIDESAILKNPQSVSARTMFEYADAFDYMYLLSGKPAPNNSTEYYAQMKLVDPDTFYMSFDSFRNMYFKGNGSKIEPISAKAEEDIANMIAVRSLIVSKHDCLEMPDMMHEICRFQLSSKIMKQYNRLYEQCIFELNLKDTQAYYSSVCQLAIFMKLRQIASGFIIDEDGVTKRIHDLKIKELIKIVNEHPDEQILIWCQFEHEILEVSKALAKYGKVVTAYGKTADIDESIRLFKEGQAKYIVAHPKSIKYGVTFVDCHLAVYYAMSYSAEDYYQSRDRIYRMGQKQICTYYYIQAEDTIDEIMYQAVSEKMSYAEIVSVLIKQAAKHGINFQDFKDVENRPVEDEYLATEIVNHKYDFEIVDGSQFTYIYKDKVLGGNLYNTLLTREEQLRPEQILFEIGFAIYCDEKERRAKKEKRNYDITYKDVKKIATWVLKELQNLNIKRIQRIRDYLQEQIQNQYDYDIANGLPALEDLDKLSIRRRKIKMDADMMNKEFLIGQFGVAKKREMSLEEIRDEMREIFFDSGKYIFTHDCFCGDDSIAHCHLDEKVIFQKKEEYENPTEHTLFDLLHEIGHLETNEDWMSTQEEEYTATQWANERRLMYGFELPKYRRMDFDIYIENFGSEDNKMYTKKRSTEMDWMN